MQKRPGFLCYCSLRLLGNTLGLRLCSHQQLGTQQGLPLLCMEFASESGLGCCCLLSMVFLLVCFSVCATQSLFLSIALSSTLVPSSVPAQQQLGYGYVTSYFKSIFKNQIEASWGEHASNRSTYHKIAGLWLTSCGCSFKNQQWEHTGCDVKLHCKYTLYGV